ncbi:MAG: hypothetical protein J1F37_07730 [Oscillospiraceae bacterium]|nr:hypothetical protein [Oscillospiraceae bacterium]
MIKNFEANTLCGKISAEDLELINRQSLKKLTEDEIFTFSVILCDNEIDRDFEVFSDEALKSLEKLFVGKTGILNHSNRSQDQMCRTYKTELICDSTRKTEYGEAYKYLKAWCYTVKSAKNEDLIKDIESGIKREVSVSCNFSEKVCSVCGESVCSHRAGEFYGDTLCFKRLNGVTDAYEWSFVAVPAQRNAGVTKTAKDRQNTRSHIEKARNEKDLGFAAQYRNEMKQRALKGFSLILPELSSSTAESIINLCNAPALSELVSAFERKTAKLFPVKSQFAENSANTTDWNSQFKF